MIPTAKLNIPYRKHTEDERTFYASSQIAPNWTIFDIERFWSQTTESAEEVAKKLTKAGFLLSRRISETDSYHGSTYNIGLYSIIFPSRTENAVLGSPHHSKTHLGSLVYWKYKGFDEEPITVQYDMDIDSPQIFEDVAKLEKFLRESNLHFQVTPTMEEIDMFTEKHRRETLRAEYYKRERAKTF